MQHNSVHTFGSWSSASDKGWQQLPAGNCAGRPRHLWPALPSSPLAPAVSAYKWHISTSKEVFRPTVPCSGEAPYKHQLSSFTASLSEVWENHWGVMLQAPAGARARSRFSKAALRRVTAKEVQDITNRALVFFSCKVLLSQILFCLFFCLKSCLSVFITKYTRKVSISLKATPKEAGRLFPARQKCPRQHCSWHTGAPGGSAALGRGNFRAWDPNQHPGQPCDSGLLCPNKSISSSGKGAVQDNCCSKHYFGIRNLSRFEAFYYLVNLLLT